MKSKISIRVTYPYPIAEVWEALTDKSALSQWLMSTEDFEPRTGAKFRFKSTPSKHWRGFVDGEVLEVQPPTKITYSWVGQEDSPPTIVTWLLQSTATGTEVTLTHSGFTGVGGFFLSKLILGPGWKKMLKVRFPAVLAFVMVNGMNFPEGEKIAECAH